MYSDGARTGHHRFLQQNNSCHCRHCIQSGPAPPPPPSPPPPPVFQAGQGFRPTSTRAPADHPSLEPRRDVQSPSSKESGGRVPGQERPERSGHRNPQRRPVFTGPGQYAQPDAFSHSCPWDLNPAQWNCPAEPGPRHYSPVREQCGCVVRRGDTGTHPFNTAGHALPLPPPPAQFRGQLKPRQANYGAEEKPCWGCTGNHYHLDTHVAKEEHLLVHTPMPNGHCEEKPAVYFPGGEDKDNSHERGRLKGGVEEGCNGRSSVQVQKVFFSTEVPQKDLNQPRRRGPCGPDLVHGPSLQGAPLTKEQAPTQGSDPERECSVREQIRQVVTNLEGVLGGLKQVHVEMKEVVQQIDYLTANIDLGEGAPSHTFPRDTPHPGGFAGFLMYNNNNKTVGDQGGSQHRDPSNHVILRTNSPSLVHMASVVKTNRILEMSSRKDPKHDPRGMNGHPPLPLPAPPRDKSHMTQTQLEPTPPPRTLDPTVIIGHSTSSSKSQKPPPYPHNGRVEKLGKGPAIHPPGSLRAPPYPGRGRQSSSMV